MGAFWGPRKINCSRLVGSIWGPLPYRSLTRGQETHNLATGCDLSPLGFFFVTSTKGAGLADDWQRPFQFCIMPSRPLSPLMHWGYAYMYLSRLDLGHVFFFSLGTPIHSTASSCPWLLERVGWYREVKFWRELSGQQLWWHLVDFISPWWFQWMSHLTQN